MDIKKYIIFVKDKKTNKFIDRTKDIEKYKKSKNVIAIVYKNTNTVYNYNCKNVSILNDPKEIEAKDIIVYIDDFPAKETKRIFDFHSYVRLLYYNNNHEVFQKSRLTFKNSCLKSKKTKTLFVYLKKLSEFISKMDDGIEILFYQYDKINKINETSVLSTYLTGGQIKKHNNRSITIFPFGVNVSQKKAVENALINSISIIEGPPGTGKTQTILNIIANLVIRDKTVGVVAGINSAVSNIQEKLNRNDFGFITALLGNSQNQRDFFNNKKNSIPNIADWKYDKQKENKLYKELINISNSLNKILHYKNSLAKLKENLSKLKLEQTYFDKNFNGKYISVSQYSFHKKWSADSILRLIAALEKSHFEETNKLITRIYLFFKFGIYKLNLKKYKLKDIINSLKNDFYKKRIEEIENKIKMIKNKLEYQNYDKLMQRYKQLSIDTLKIYLYNKYNNINKNKQCNIRNFRNNFRAFIKEYPVILSTTHSIKTSISDNYLFDYLIIDEASQVDIITASLALSCCKNVVIVGDINQLPPIVPEEIKRVSDKMFYENNLEKQYDYTKYSIISSLIQMYGEELPKTLLTEHYRCHPKIIGFCNEKFYDNKLVIMTDEKANDNPLKIFKTAPGNHARKVKIGDVKGWYNLRQIEVIRDEIIYDKSKYNSFNSVGIISPYRRHVLETKNMIKIDELEVSTVHKFQGREKDTILFSTVNNSLTNFVDDPNLINVAVSRAVKEFIIITSNKLFKKHGTNIGDLLRYIEYNSPENSVIESDKISVFDLLYSEYSAKLLEVMTKSKKISKHKSENFMYRVIEEVLSNKTFSSFKCVIHVPLNSIVKNTNNLSDREKAFVENPWTHVDFLIFNKLNKEPVLVVEVDGHRYHKNNQKQQERDNLKDKILSDINLQILRIATNESGEKEKLINMLKEIVKKS